MIGGLKAIFRPKKKRKSGGKSSISTRVSFRLPNELMPVLRRRAIKWNGGNISEYVAYKMIWHLTRKHVRTRGMKRELG